MIGLLIFYRCCTKAYILQVLHQNFPKNRGRVMNYQNYPKIKCGDQLPKLPQKQEDYKVPNFLTSVSIYVKDYSYICVDPEALKATLRRLDRLAGKKMVFCTMIIFKYCTQSFLYFKFKLTSWGGHDQLQRNLLNSSNILQHSSFWEETGYGT